MKTSHILSNPITANQLRKLRQVVGEGPVLILTHDNPDPDALSSGATFASLIELKWGVKSYLGYSGLIARAENKAMLEVLTPQWKPLESLGNLHEFPVCALVDTQPGAGNNSLPLDIVPQIIFDHHPAIQNNFSRKSFVDIRPEMGATTSLIFQYFEAAGLESDAVLATAIFYGIQTDTQGLSRPSSQADQDIYLKLLSRIDRSKLNKVIQARVPREYFQAFNKGLVAAQVFEKTIVSYLGKLPRPDFAAELADALIRLEGIEAVLCLGYHQNMMYISLRTPLPSHDAGKIIQSIVHPHGRAGGHGSMAGGQIRIQEEAPDELAEAISKRFLKRMNERINGEKLIL